MIFISLLIPLKKDKEDLLLWGQRRETQDDYFGLFEFPGGKIEKNESPSEAVIREVFEETRVKINSSDLDLAFIHTDLLNNKPIRFYAFFTKMIFPLENYREIDNLLNASIKIPPINMSFLKNHQFTMKNYLN